MARFLITVLGSSKQNFAGLGIVLGLERAGLGPVTAGLDYNNVKI